MDYLQPGNLMDMVNSMHLDMRCCAEANIFYLAAYDPQNWWVVKGKPLYVATWQMTQDKPAWLGKQFCTVGLS